MGKRELSVSGGCGDAVIRGFCLMLNGVTVAERKGMSFASRDEGDKGGEGGGGGGGNLRFCIPRRMNWGDLAWL